MKEAVKKSQNLSDFIYWRPLSKKLEYISSLTLSWEG